MTTLCNHQLAKSLGKYSKSLYLPLLLALWVVPIEVSASPATATASAATAFILRFKKPRTTADALEDSIEQAEKEPTIRMDLAAKKILLDLGSKSIEPREISLSSFEPLIARDRYLLTQLDNDSLPDILLNVSHPTAFDPYESRYLALLSSKDWIADSSLVWASFPANLPIAEIRSAQLLGDTRHEIIVRGKQSDEAWIAIPDVHYGIEFPLRLPVEVIEAEHYRWRDFTGDGFADLLVITKTHLLGFESRLSEHFATAIEEFHHVEQQGVCVGYHPGEYVRWGAWQRTCPANYGIIATNDLTRGNLYRSKTGFRHACCPQPYPGLFTGVRTWREARCQDDELLVGVEPEFTSSIKKRQLLCERIDSSRYRLSESTVGALWGAGGSNSLFGGGYLLETIPLSIRYGVSRQNFASFGEDGCVGVPPGSLLSNFSAQRGCGGFEYRQVEVVDGTTPIGFIECSELESVFTPLARCLPAVRNPTPADGPQRVRLEE